MKELLEQLNARFETEGGIELTAYHSVGLEMTTPASGLGGGLPIEFNVSLCGYPEGSNQMELRKQALGQGETFEQALEELKANFEKKK